MTPSRFAFALAALLLCADETPLSAQPAKRQLKAVEQIWGFDGRVQPGQFNPLSILLDNQTDDSVEGTLTLQRVQNVLNPTGNLYEQDVFLSATARRWIQFYPYISDTRNCEWHLFLNGKKIGEFMQPRSAWKEFSDKTDQPPQVVILDRADRISTRPATVKHMPENIFPPYATATFGLHTAFLDHVPDWELPRQDAFMSWLKLGGRLQLLLDSRGEFPRFSGSLVDLNQPLDQFNVGSGVVVRNPIRRNDVSEEVVRRAMVVDVRKGVDRELEKNLQQQFNDMGYGGMGALVETEPNAIDEMLFRQMRELTLPEHAWWLIFLLALCYIGLIFPGCFALSRKKHLHFLATYGAIVGLSVVFSMLFLVIGRRGYGEETNLQTLAYARAEDETHWNIFQWNALFVTSGDEYAASVEKQQAVLSTGDTTDRSDARSTTGNTAGIRMRIPPFSSQTFVSRRRVESDPWGLKLHEVTRSQTGLVSLTIGAGSGLPRSKSTKYYVLAGRHVWELRYNEASKALKLYGSKRALAEICQPQYMQNYMNPTGPPADTAEAKAEEQTFYSESVRTLMQRSLLDDLIRVPARFELPPDRLRLYVYTELPDGFELDVSAQVKSVGRILFCRDLFTSGGP